MSTEYRRQVPFLAVQDLLQPIRNRKSPFVRDPSTFASSLRGSRVMHARSSGIPVNEPARPPMSKAPVFTYVDWLA